jgi:hypothetical protein
MGSHNWGERSKCLRACMVGFGTRSDKGRLALIMGDLQSTWLCGCQREKSFRKIT